MWRPILRVVAGVAGMLSCAYAVVVLFIGMISVHQWFARGVPQRALWIAGAMVLMLIPGIAVAVASMWYLWRRRDVSVDPRAGFPVLPPR